MQDKRVLVVEDDEDIRRNICAIMRDLGCMVKDFGDAEQALRYARGAPVDLLMTDAILPGVSGFVLARELQMQSAIRFCGGCRDFYLWCMSASNPSDARSGWKGDKIINRGSPKEVSVH